MLAEFIIYVDKTVFCQIFQNLLMQVIGRILY